MATQKIPPARWPDGFNESRLQRLYLLELYWLAHRIVECCNALFSQHPQQPVELYAAADIESLELAFGALSYASKIRDLLFPTREKPLYNERAEALRLLLKNVNYSALIDKKVRNTLEHFPEYLDDTNYIHSTIPPKRPYAVAFNFVFSHLYATEPTSFPFPAYLSPINETIIFPVRVFVASTRVVHNFFWSTDIGVLAEQAKAVKTAIGAHLGEGKHEEWISGLIMFGPTVA